MATTPVTDVMVNLAIGSLNDQIQGIRDFIAANPMTPNAALSQMIDIVGVVQNNINALKLELGMLPPVITP